MFAYLHYLATASTPKTAGRKRGEGRSSPPTVSKEGTPNTGEVGEGGSA